MFEKFFSSSTKAKSNTTAKDTKNNIAASPAISTSRAPQPTTGSSKAPSKGSNNNSTAPFSILTAGQVEQSANDQVILSWDVEGILKLDSTSLGEALINNKLLERVLGKHDEIVAAAKNSNFLQALTKLINAYKKALKENQPKQSIADALQYILPLPLEQNGEKKEKYESAINKLIEELFQPLISNAELPDNSQEIAVETATAKVEARESGQASNISLDVVVNAVNAALVELAVPPAIERNKPGSSTIKDVPAATIETIERITTVVDTDLVDTAHSHEPQVVAHNTVQATGVDADSSTKAATKENNEHIAAVSSALVDATTFPVLEVIPLKTTPQPAVSDFGATSKIVLKAFSSPIPGRAKNRAEIFSNPAGTTADLLGKLSLGSPTLFPAARVLSAPPLDNRATNDTNQTNNRNNSHGGKKNNLMSAPPALILPPALPDVIEQDSQMKSSSDSDDSVSTAEPANGSPSTALRAGILRKSSSGSDDADPASASSSPSLSKLRKTRQQQSATTNYDGSSEDEESESASASTSSTASSTASDSRRRGRKHHSSRHHRSEKSRKTNELLSTSLHRRSSKGKTANDENEQKLQKRRSQSIQKPALSKTNPDLAMKLIDLIRNHKSIELEKKIKESSPVLNEVITEDGKTLLHLAVYHLDVEAIKVLVSNGADVSAKDKDGCTPLDYLILPNKFITRKVSKYKDDASYIKALNSSREFLTNIENYPFWKAVSALDCEAASKSVAAYAGCMSNANNLEQNVLHCLASSNNQEQARESSHTRVAHLIFANSNDAESAALLNKQDRAGDTPLHLACRHGLLDLALFLAEQEGANVKLKNKVGDTCLFDLIEFYNNNKKTIEENDGLFKKFQDLITSLKLAGIDIYTDNIVRKQNGKPPTPLELAGNNKKLKNILLNTKVIRKISEKYNDDFSKDELLAMLETHLELHSAFNMYLANRPDVKELTAMIRYFELATKHVDNLLAVTEAQSDMEHYKGETEKYDAASSQHATVFVDLLKPDAPKDGVLKPVSVTVSSDHPDDAKRKLYTHSVRAFSQQTKLELNRSPAVLMNAKATIKQILPMCMSQERYLKRGNEMLAKLDSVKDESRSTQLKSTSNSPSVAHRAKDKTSDRGESRFPNAKSNAIVPAFIPPLDFSSLTKSLSGDSSSLSDNQFGIFAKKGGKDRSSSIPVYSAIVDVVPDMPPPNLDDDKGDSGIPTLGYSSDSSSE
jgi:ankyrin repeat protein